MELGKYIDGRPLSYDEGSGTFRVGDAPVSADQVRGYSSAGQIAWTGPSIAAWFDSGFPAVAASSPTASGPTDSAAVTTGYCQACGSRVNLREDSSCVNAHPRSQIRDVKDAAESEPVVFVAAQSVPEAAPLPVKQIIIGVAAFWTVLALIFPPWYYQLAPSMPIEQGGWGFIGAPPVVMDTYGQRVQANLVDFQRLGLELGIIVIVAGAAYVLTKKA